jgi:hypothetical protein
MKMDTLLSHEWVYQLSESDRIVFGNFHLGKATSYGLKFQGKTDLV